MDDDSSGLLASDDVLGARLDSALRDLDSDQVDVAALLHGSRHRARRIRTRRIASVATAAALVVAVPVGYEVTHPHPGSGGPPAAMIPSGAGSGPARTWTGTRTAEPRPTPAATAEPPFPFTEAELPTTMAASGPSRPIPGTVVGGQVCGRTGTAGVQAARPLTARQWVWSGTRPQDRELRISLTVTRWADGQAPIAFRGAVTGTGSCTWIDPQRSFALAGDLGDESWAATSGAAARPGAVALVRVEDTIVGVQVQDPDDAASTAQRLIRVQATRLGG